MARDMKLDILRELDDELPRVQSLAGGVTALFSQIDGRLSALPTVEGWKLYDMIREMESSVVELLASALEGNSEAIVPIAVDLDPKLLIHRFKLYWASAVFSPHEHLKRYTKKLRAKVSCKHCFKPAHYTACAETRRQSSAG
jgi:hypothetical protein